MQRVGVKTPEVSGRLQWRAVIRLPEDEYRKKAGKIESERINNSTNSYYLVQDKQMRDPIERSETER